MIEVLIADDSKLARKRIKDILTRVEFENRVVSECCNGQEAILDFARHKCELVFMDIEMPKLNGVEAIKKIKEMSPDVFIIIVSSVVNRNIIDIYKGYKNICVVNKPVDEEKMISYLEPFKKG